MSNGSALVTLASIIAVVALVDGSARAQQLAYNTVSGLDFGSFRLG